MAVSAFNKTIFTSLISLASAGTTAGGFAVVTNGDNDGVGSLRYALETKQASTIFVVPSVDMINLESTLNYDPKKRLRLLGSGQTLKLDKNETLLSVNNGANLFVSDLTFEGKPGFTVLKIVAI